MTDNSNTFKDTVIKYIKLDDTIKQKLEEIKELKAKKKETEEYIISYLEKSNNKAVEIKNNTLRLNKYESKSTLKIDEIKDTLKNKMSDPTMIETIFENMNNKREKKIRVSLKRTHKKQNNIEEIE